jgi:4-aminobutyrate aminotransferase-like enzyme
VIRDEGRVEAAETRGARLRGLLEELAERHSLVQGLRGCGLLRGVELRDPGSGFRFAESANVSGRLAAAARERGLMIYACPTPVGNEHMDAVLLAPPLIISDAELDELAEKLDGALDAVERSL